MRSLDEILTDAFYKSASDVHLTTGSPPVYRINGMLIPQKDETLTYNMTRSFTQEIITSEMWEVLEDKRELDFSYGINGVSRFRVNTFYQRNSLSLAFRIIATLAALIDYMNQTMTRHIITLEDPIEYLHNHKQSIVVQREVGFDTLSFKNGLRASLRQDPDVILVGELRDLDTISTAITASETGHLVLGTLHTSDAAGSIERMIDVFPTEQRDQIRMMLANVLIGILSQRLIPTLDGKGRTAVTEMLINNSAVKNLIRTEKMHQIQNVLQTSAGHGMHTMNMSISRLVKEERISRHYID